MLGYVLRRLWQAVLTIIGVMIITFLLFRVVAGDISADWVGARATRQMRADWNHRHGYDKPMLLNIHGRLLLTDTTQGDGVFAARDAQGSNAANALALVQAVSGAGDEGQSQSRSAVLEGRWVAMLDRDTPLSKLTGAEPMLKRAAEGGARQDRPEAAGPTTAPVAVRPALDIQTASGVRFSVDLAGVRTAGDVIDRVNQAAGNEGRVVASVSPRRKLQVFDSQFFHHFWASLTFASRSLRDNKPLTTIIAERASESLAITVPAMAMGWMVALTLASVVAYYRGTAIDKVGVFLSVLGMCVPLLAWVIYGQWFMFWLAPQHAYGTFYAVNVYVPIVIVVVAGLGGSVRFYRTILLDEVGRDYVRTARAKGVALPSILFKHVLKNCMLPILTNLITAIPFLIMGNLLLEQYFGIPGLGDLMITAIGTRDEPIINGLVFLTALIYTLGVLVTDLSYALFDPRVRLR